MHTAFSLHSACDVSMDGYIIFMDGYIIFLFEWLDSCNRFIDFIHVTVPLMFFMRVNTTDQKFTRLVSVIGLVSDTRFWSQRFCDWISLWHQILISKVPVLRYVGVRRCDRAILSVWVQYARRSCESSRTVDGQSSLWRRALWWTYQTSRSE